MDGLIMLLIAIAIIVVAVRSISTIYKLAKKGPILQTRLDKFGKIVTGVSSVGIVVLPRLLGVRYDLSEKEVLAYMIIVVIGFIAFFIGLKFRISAYKKIEDTPKWHYKIVNYFSSSSASNDSVEDDKQD